jgi:hypothetical protein
MPLPGKDAKIKTCATKGGSYVEIDGIKDWGFDPQRDLIETTDFKGASAGSGDYDETRTHTFGLKSGSASFSGDYEPGDTLGQAALITAADAGSAQWFHFLADGSAGFEVEAYIKYSISQSVDGVAQISFSLTTTSAWGAA